MKVVVTGGAGFIGANLCHQLATTAGIDQVVVIDDLSSGDVANLDGVDAELVKGSILDPDALDAVMTGASSVVHLAARPSVPRSIADPAASHEVNATGTMRVLEAVRRHHVGHVVVASSSSVYGANATLPKHEDLALRPASPYAASKLATESYTLAWAQVWGFQALAFRLFNVYGPLQAAGHAYAAVVPAFVSAALAGEPLVIHGDGGQTRDFTFVGTVCRTMAAAVSGGRAHPEPVNLAFGGRHRLLDVVDQLEAILDRELVRHFVEVRAGDVRDSQADQRRLRSLFPDIRPVELPEGLVATVEWSKAVQAGVDHPRLWPHTGQTLEDR